MELRFQPTNLRANDDGTMKVEGYVNKTEQLSNVLGASKRFREKIAKGAFQRAIQNSQRDIDFLAEHKEKLILASTRNQSLKLVEDEQDLFMSANIAATSWGADYYELINSGLLRNMSFGFRTIKDSWKQIDSSLYERTIDELELFEISVVKDPAYSQSTISARGINLVNEVTIPSDETMEKKIRNKEETNEMRTTMKVINAMPKEQEKRQADFDQFAGYMKEDRYLQMTSDGTALIPESVADVVVKKMEETAPVFARAKKFSSTYGNLTIPRESLVMEAGFVGEGQDVIEGAIAFEEVKLTQKRYGAAITLTNQLLNDSAMNMVDYVADLLARRVGKTAEKSILTGNSVDEFRGIIHDVDIANVAVTEITYDSLMDVYNSVHPDYLVGAVFIVGRQAFNTISKLKDEAGHFYLQRGVVNGKPVQTLFGAEVIITNSLPAETPIVFGNIELGYALMIKENQGIQMIQDTQTAFKGTKMFLYDVYADGAVYNPEALAKLTLQ